MSSPEQLVRRFDVRRIDQQTSERVIDWVSVEEPLALRIRYWFKEAPRSSSLAVTMRTPGNDVELAAGYLLAEGVIRGRRDLGEVSVSGNEVTAELSPGVDVESWRLRRDTLLSASCGICGKRTLEALATDIPPIADRGFKVGYELIRSLPGLLRSQQRGFAHTGGLHAAALVSESGDVTAEFEDIGRHNAMDKVIGRAFLNGQTPLSDSLVLLSSRSSFELIQKAAMAGVCAVATIGGPSSMAIEAARQWGITLIGFIRDQHFNVYSGEWRVHS